MNRARIAFALFIFSLLVVCLYRLLTTPNQVSAYSTGPPAARTGAPGEGTCLFCHFSYPLNDPSGGVTIDGLPDSYVVHGDPIAFTVTVFQDGTDGIRKDWGFELTVLDASEIFAGTLVASDATNTQIVDALVKGNDRYYIEQTLDGTFFNPDGNVSATWSMTWIPPCTDVGPVTFYVAANAGNGDHRPVGDYIFTSQHMVFGQDPSAGNVPSGLASVRQLRHRAEPTGRNQFARGDGASLRHFHPALLAFADTNRHTQLPWPRLSSAHQIPGY